MLLAGGRKGTHTVRWANGLASRGIDVHLVTQQHLTGDLHRSVKVHQLRFTGGSGYLLNAKRANALFRSIQPDIVNAHYASGYGTLARMARLSPLLLSVWGSDVYDFPDKSMLHLYWLRKNLEYADAIASTSKSMAWHVKNNIGFAGKVYVTPFGIDTDYFAPDARKEPSPASKVIIGTVKSLSNKYGIDTLLRAFANAKAKCSGYDLRLEIAGDGRDADRLRRLSEQLGIGDYTVFHGFVDREGVRRILRRLDVYVALSRLESESFGVALLEASACELPLVVSDVSGPAEVVQHGATGFIVPRNDAEAAAERIVELIRNERLRVMMGRAGRKHVNDNYTWEESLDTMIGAYNEVLS